MTSTDPDLERAFETMRNAQPLHMPDPDLERRLLGRLQSSSSRSWRRSLRWPVALGALSGVALAAGPAVEWLHSWSYRMEIGDQVVAGDIEGDGGHAFEATLPDGGRATANVRRQRGDDGSVETTLELVHDGQGRANRDVHVHREGGADQERTRSLDVLEGRTPLLVGIDANAVPFELYLCELPGREGDPAGAELVVHRPASGALPFVATRVSSENSLRGATVRAESIGGSDVRVRIQKGFWHDITIELNVGGVTEFDPVLEVPGIDARLEVTPGENR